MTELEEAFIDLLRISGGRAPAITLYTAMTAVLGPRWSLATMQATLMDMVDAGKVALDDSLQVFLPICSDCERCRWNPDADCGKAEHPHCERCGHCAYRHITQVP